jgi:hypothetical protein
MDPPETYQAGFISLSGHEQNPTRLASHVQDQRWNGKKFAYQYVTRIGIKKSNLHDAHCLTGGSVTDFSANG